LIKKVCVVGLGYIGLPTASVLAANGFEVLGVDVAPHVVETVNRGDIHIEEPGLHTVVQAAIQSGNLRAAAAPEPADVFLIAVPTPLTPENTPNMEYVVRAAQSLVPHLRRSNLIILESTSPPGTCRTLLKPILEESGLLVGEDIYLAYCPERVLPGKILKELIDNDRIIGGYDVLSAEHAQSLYASFVEGELFLTDSTTAETVKLLENTFRDVNIALANEAALLCEQLGVNFWQVARFANRHPRVHVHQAGPGVGGHCIPVDPWFLVETDPATAKFIRQARARNDAMPGHVAETVQRLLQEVGTPKIAVLGLAYKGNVDDVRESPAVRIVELLNAAGLAVRCHDPHVKQPQLPNASFEECVAQADCLLLLTDHDEYKSLNPRALVRQMRTPLVYDARNMIDHAAWREAGFNVHLLGAG
jgi:UDP-N-acetyl-D-mannosaminuronic acid dehydrogenase